MENDGAMYFRFGTDSPQRFQSMLSLRPTRADATRNVERYSRRILSTAYESARRRPRTTSRRVLCERVGCAQLKPRLSEHFNLLRFQHPTDITRLDGGRCRTPFRRRAQREQQHKIRGSNVKTLCWHLTAERQFRMKFQRYGRTVIAWSFAVRSSRKHVLNQFAFLFSCVRHRLA